jgi:hypothetical protein
MSENETWLEVVARARRTLRPKQYREWQFIVGNDGDEEERRERGQRALKEIKPAPGPTEIKFNWPVKTWHERQEEKKRLEAIIDANT